MLDECVVPEVSTAVQNLAEQVTVASVLHDDVCVIAFLDYAVESHDTRVRGS